MAKKKPTGGLGRGLGDIVYDSLLSDNEKVELTSVGSIPLAQIESVNNFQPREDFNEEALDELADSIRIHGIIQPLTVRKLHEGKYQLIAGERRFRAAKIVGLDEVPVFIRTANDEEMLEIALIENIQREIETVLKDSPTADLIAFSKEWQQWLTETTQMTVKRCHLGERALAEKGMI